MGCHTLTLKPQAAPSLKGGLIRHLRLQSGLPRPCCCAGASPAWPMQLPGLCPSCPCPGGLLAQRLYALQGHVEPGLGAEQPALQCKKWSELLCSTGSGLSCHGDGSMSDLSCRQDVLEGQQAPSCSAPDDNISADVPAIGGQCQLAGDQLDSSKLQCTPAQHRTPRAWLRCGVCQSRTVSQVCQQSLAAVPGA